MGKVIALQIDNIFILSGSNIHMIYELDKNLILTI